MTRLTNVTPFGRGLHVDAAHGERPAAAHDVPDAAATAACLIEHTRHRMAVDMLVETADPNGAVAHRAYSRRVRG